MNAPTTLYKFDDRNVRWYPLVDHIEFSMVAVDDDRRMAEFLARFAARQRIVLHKHLAQTNILVIAGEHRIYHPDGSLKEIRPVGSYTASAPGGPPHYEGGGDEDCVVLYSVRAGEEDVCFEIMDDDQNVVATLGLAEFKAFWHAQQSAA